MKRLVFGTVVDWENKRFLKKLYKRLGCAGVFDCLICRKNYGLQDVRDRLNVAKSWRKFAAAVGLAMTNVLVERIKVKEEQEQALRKLKFLEKLK
jgi:hypothetical protein